MQFLRVNLVSTIKEIDSCFLCKFCGKRVKSQKPAWNTISASHCVFCIRHSFYLNNDIFIMNFSSIFNFYRENLYKKSLWMSQIEDLMEEHRKIGLKNPLFVYDEDTNNWFVDFSKDLLEEILVTTKDICDIFKKVNAYPFYEKALMDFSSEKSQKNYTLLLK